MRGSLFLTMQYFIKNLLRLCLVALMPAALAQEPGKSAEAVSLWYADMAWHRYNDSLTLARQLVEHTNQFLRDPSAQTQAALKQAWIDAHSVYSHTEAFRFGNPNVDAWEGNVNAWPLDEGFIDYVVADRYRYDESNPHALENLIATHTHEIHAGFIREAQSGNDPKEGQTFRFTDFETNVSMGYHAAEFLIWGQDLNQAANVAGQRSWTDYLVGDGCTHGNCKRRGQYLSAVTRLLVQDLMFALRDWDPKGQRLYSKVFRSLPVSERLRRMLVGLGNMSYGELAGERMRVAMIASDQEDEQSCFSDTTHLAIYHNAAGIRSLYLGEHTSADGTKLSGASLSGLVARMDAKLDERLRTELDATMVAAAKLREAADAGMPFDQMVQADNAQGRAFIQNLIQALAAQTASFEQILERVDELASL